MFGEKSKSRFRKKSELETQLNVQLHTQLSSSLKKNTVVAESTYVTLDAERRMATNK